jgi:hypothetical protein
VLLYVWLDGAWSVLLWRRRGTKALCILYILSSDHKQQAQKQRKRSKKRKSNEAVNSDHKAIRKGLL